MILLRSITSIRARLGPRGQVILQTGSWSLIAKAIAAINLFLCVPFVLRALGPTQFGAWATLASLVMFSNFLDFGLGNGTMNLVAAAHGHGNTAEVAAILHEGRKTLWRIAATLAIVMAITVPLTPWYRLLGQPLAMAGDSRWAATSVLFAIVFAIPLNLANRVQLGLGRGNIAFRWQAVGQLITIGTVIMLARNGASLPVLTAATVFTPLCGALANTLNLARAPAFAAPPTQRPDLAKRIRHEGLLFFVLQLAAALAYSADLPLISALRGPYEAGTYAIVQRLFSVVPLGLNLVWAPLWPIYRQALATKDHAWIRRTLLHSILMAIIFSASTSILFLLAFNQIIRVWIRHTLVVEPMLLVGLTIWSILDAIGTAISTFFNAASLMRFQAITATTFATTCFLTKAVVIAHIGMSAVPWATIATYSATTLLPIFLLRPKLEKLMLAKNY